MDFRIYITEILEQWYWYIPILFLFIIFYLYLFKKYIWSIFDPLVVTLVMMGGAAFAVFTLWINEWSNFKYIFSFLCTELSLILGFILMSHLLEKADFSYKTLNIYTDLKLLKVLSFLVGGGAFILQIYAFTQLGFGLFREGVNHVSIYDGFGGLKAFQGGLNTTFFISFFYKKKIFHLNSWDYLFFFTLVLATILSGSKSGILRPIVIFFVIDYYFFKKTGQNVAHVKWGYLVLLAFFPLLVISLMDKVGFLQSVLLFGARLVGSGDIFVMGYDDDVIRHISAHSFLQYICYPGWGSILKTIGFSITPPTVIGVDIYNYHYNLTDAGPNTRVNFLTYYFFGTFIGSIISLIVGFFIGYVRYKYGLYKHTIFMFFLSTYLYLSVLSIISDINIFLNDFFWNCVVFILFYFLSQLVCKSLAIKYE